MIRFRVDGTPVAQGNHRTNAHGATYETTKGHRPWRDSVTWQARQARGRLTSEQQARWAIAPLSVLMIFALARPKGHYGTGRNAGRVKPSAPPYPAGKPDVSKLVRAVEDAITVSRLWGDDGQVAELTACKVWCGEGQAPGVTIEIEEMK